MVGERSRSNVPSSRSSALVLTEERVLFCVSYSLSKEYKRHIVNACAVTLVSLVSLVSLVVVTPEKFRRQHPKMVTYNTGVNLYASWLQKGHKGTQPNNA